MKSHLANVFYGSDFLSFTTLELLMDNKYRLLFLWTLYFRALSLVFGLLADKVVRNN